MSKKIFVAFGYNCLLERLSVDKMTDTVAGRVLSSNNSRLKFNDLVLYKAEDSTFVKVQDGKIVDAVWDSKIVAKLIEEVEK